MTQETAASGTTTPVPQQRAVELESAADQVRTSESVESVKPVSFDRLLTVAVLTPAQAALVAVQLFDAAHLGGPGDGESPVRTCLGAVTLTPSGDVEVSRAPADAGTPVTELLEQLLQNARRLPAHPRSDQLVLLHRLEEAAGAPVLDPGTRARELETALADTLGPGARQRLAGQLAALVDAFAHVAPGAPAGDDTPRRPYRGGRPPLRRGSPAPRPLPARPGPAPAVLPRHDPRRTEHLAAAGSCCTAAPEAAWRSSHSS